MAAGEVVVIAGIVYVNLKEIGGVIMWEVGTGPTVDGGRSG